MNQPKKGDNIRLVVEGKVTWASDYDSEYEITPHDGNGIVVVADKATGIPFEVLAPALPENWPPKFGDIWEVDLKFYYNNKPYLMYCFENGKLRAAHGNTLETTQWTEDSIWHSGSDNDFKRTAKLVYRPDFSGKVTAG